jgi:hypothetical protein
MGLDDDGDQPAGRTEEAEDIGDVDMDIEETTYEFLKNLEKHSGSTSLQKEVARSAGTSGTTTTTCTAIGTTTGIEEEGMDRWQLRMNSSTSTSTIAMTATGMKKIDEEDEEEQEEDELKMKTRNWRNINLSFTVELVLNCSRGTWLSAQKARSTAKYRHRSKH